MPSSVYQRSRILDPLAVPALRFGRRHEELHLHLLELAGAEDEVAGRDLVAEGLADLGDAEGRLLAGEAEHVLEVDEDALGGLGPQVDLRALARDRADMGLEHQVELARLGELAAALRAAQLGARVAAFGFDRLAQVILAPALLALAEALDQRVGEAFEVARGLPDPRVLEDRRVEGDDVVAFLQHRPPPLGLDVVLQQHPVVAVVVGRAEAAVDLRGGEDEAAPLAERDDLLHRDLGRALLLLGRLPCAEPYAAAIIPRPCRSTSTNARTGTSST